MSLESARGSLEKITKSLDGLRSDREYVIKSSRDVVGACGQAIVKVHAGEIKEAEQMAAKARQRLREIRGKALQGTHPGLAVAEQELAEALALIAIVNKKPVPTHKTMSVSGPGYVLGLLDCIGELKRRVLDKIRTGDVGEAVRVFDIMSGLYEILYPFAAYDKVVKEARRKLDVNRELIERARFAVAESAGRARLEELLRKSP